MRHFLLLAFLAILGVGLYAQPQADSDAKLSSNIDFKMPQSAIDAELDGDVLIRVNVEASGKASKAEIVSGLMWPCGKSPVKEIDDLSSAISDAIIKATFSPEIKKGKAKDSVIGLTFKIRNPLLAGKPEIDPATGKALPSTISGGVLNGKATYLAKPSYPEEAKASRASGSISVKILINEQGNVTRVGYESGKVIFLPGTLPAVCQSKFSPTLLQGRPIRVSGIVTYNFVP